MPNEAISPELMGGAAPQPSEMDEQTATPTLDDTAENKTGAGYPNNGFQ